MLDMIITKLKNLSNFATESNKNYLKSSTTNGRDKIKIKMAAPLLLSN